MKIYVLMYDCSQYEGVFSSVEKAVEYIKSQHDDDYKITRIEQNGRYCEIYTPWGDDDDTNSYTIIEEDLDGTDFYGRT